VEKLLTRFLQSGVLPNQLGVITPYEGQRAHVVATLLRHGEPLHGLRDLGGAWSLTGMHAVAAWRRLSTALHAL
jgi:hypothetical protein